MEALVIYHLKKECHPSDYLGVCCPSVSHISRDARLNLLSYVSGPNFTHLQLGRNFLQVQYDDYSILMAAKIPAA